MNNIKLSVIIPTYNSAEYIDKCLKSVLTQTLKDIEIIVVDDVSTDNTVEIVEAYKQKDNRIILLKNDENLCPGGARNRGLEIARGEFIGFVDSDDWVESDYFEKMYDSACKYNCDIAVSSMLKHKKYYKKYLAKYTKTIMKSDIQDKIKLCGKQALFYVTNKIYRKSLLTQNKIKFEPKCFYEDIMFSIKSLYYANGVVCCPKALYHYIKNKNSVINSKTNSARKRQDKINANQALQLFCKEKEIILPERHNYYTDCWYNIFIKTRIGIFKQKVLLFGFIPINKRNIDYTFPVDLVYLWVDGNDPTWRTKKQYWQNKLSAETELDAQSTDNGRFIDNEELKYSLRSVEKYAPWINKIFIVTDNQIPKWLDTTNPKIKVAFHQDFIPKENLPLFNSEAIESYLYRISGLSTHFLYANDDCYINNFVNKDFFFDTDGNPIVRLKHQVSKKNIPTSMYTRSILFQQKLIKDKFGKNYPFAPHHNIDAYNAQTFANCIDIFKDKWELTRLHKFREEGSIQRTSVLYYMLAVGAGRLKKYSRVDRFLSPFARLKCIFGKKYCADSTVISMKNKNPYSRLRKYNSALFCTNDGEGITNFDRARIKIFLEETFPEKSQFEK